jgi:hypothetical protein
MKKSARKVYDHLKKKTNIILSEPCWEKKTTLPAPKSFVVGVFVVRVTGSEIRLLTKCYKSLLYLPSYIFSFMDYRILLFKR